MMRVVDLRSNPFFRLCIAIVAAVSLTILVLSFVLYMSFDGIITHKTVTLVRANLNQLAESTGQTLNSVEKTLVQAYFDDTLQRFGFNQPPEEGDLNRGLDQLEKYRFVSSTIQSMYILNKATATAYIASDTASSKVQSFAEFFDRGVFSEIKDYRGDRPFVPLGRSLPLGNEAPERPASLDAVTLLFYDAVNPVAAGSVLVANLGQSLFRDRLSRIEGDAPGSHLIIDHQGMVIAGRAEDEARWVKDLQTASFSERHGSEPGSETLLVGGVPSLVTWTAEDRNGWRYLNVVPTATMVTELDSLRQTMIEAALVVLLVGIFASALGAWFLYKPIEQTLARVGQLEKESRVGQGALREQILRRILTEPQGGDLAPPEQQELTAFAITLVPQARCRVVLLRLDQYRLLVSQLTAHDLGQMKNALMADARETLASWGPLEVVDMEEDRVAVVATSRSEPSDNDLSSALAALQARVLASWSETGENLGYAAFLYRQALQNSFHRFFQGHGCLISPIEATTRRPEDYTYPASKERQLIEALMLRNLVGTKAHYLDIVNDLNGRSPSTVNLAVSHLCLGLVMALDSLRSHWFSDVPFHFDTTVNLGDFETVEEMNRHFFDLFEGVVTLMNTRRHHKQNDLVGRVNQLIEKEYANPNLSLDFIADHLDLTPTHVSKAYRKTCLRAIPDVILELRIRRCRELLAQTDLTIAQVAEDAGFRNANYFHTLFRKVEGITPAEFRKQRLAQVAATNYHFSP